MVTLFAFLAFCGVYGVGAYYAMEHFDPGHDHYSKKRFALTSTGVLGLLTAGYGFVLYFPTLVWMAGATILSVAMYKERLAVIDAATVVGKLTTEGKENLLMLYNHYTDKAVKLLPWKK